MSRSIVISILVSFVFMFAGCTKILLLLPKRPAVKNISVNHVSVNQNIKELILKEVLRESFPSGLNTWYLSGNCLITYHKVNNNTPTLTYCYKLSGNTLTASYGGFIGDSQNFANSWIVPLNKARNKIEKEFNQKYTKKVNDFVKFRKEYLNILYKEHSSNRYKLLIETLDTTKTLPANILKSIQSTNNNKWNTSLVFSEYGIPIRFNKLEQDSVIWNYYKQFSNNQYESVDKFFKDQLSLSVVYQNPVTNYKRYQFSYVDKNKKSWDIEHLPKKYTLKINKVSFNFMPKEINTADYNIAVSIDTSSSGNNVTIHNGLKKFITINTISVYYNGQIESQEIHLKIPPFGIFKTSFNVNNSNKYIDLKSKNQKVEVGTAIEYTIIDTGAKKSLFETKQLSQFDF